MVWSFLFILLNKALILRKVLGEKSEKSVKSVDKRDKVWKSAETILAFCPLVVAL